jgi:hypothetical protein
MAKEKKTQDLEKSIKILTGVSANEPTVSKGEDYQYEMAKALNWYNSSWDEKAYQISAVQYVKKAGLKNYIHAVSEADFLEVRLIGVIGRLMMRDQYVHPNDVEKVMVRLEQLKRKYKNVESTQTDRKTVQERIKDVASDHIAAFEGAIDDMLANGTEFSAKSYLISNEVSGVVAKKIADYFRPIAEELNQISKDEQLKEAYSHLSAGQIRKLKALVQSFIEDGEQQKVSATVRKPRKKKEKPASKIVEKVKYMKEFEELKLKSINPAKIIGSSELWIYQPKARKLTVFRAAEGGLNVKGQSIINFDISQTETKTLRKPAEFFKGLTLSKRPLNAAWKAIKAKVSKPKARINDEMVLLAAL